MIYFVTPAHGRLGLSEVCFDQRVQVIEALAALGIDARCVVVANDRNVDLAIARGFDVVEQSNDYLGRKFNDGIEFAGRRGADWIVPIGSDSWIDPGYFAGLHARFTRTSTTYCAVTADRLAELTVLDGKGAGPYVFPRSLLRACAFRPADDRLTRHIDSSTIRGIRRAGGRILWSPSYDLHPYQYVGFRGTPTITPYETLVRAWGRREHADPWALLARHYPADLVARARLALAGVPA